MTRHHKNMAMRTKEIFEYRDFYGLGGGSRVPRHVMYIKRPDIFGHQVVQTWDQGRAKLSPYRQNVRPEWVGG
ncbi:hypothetical protein J6590_011539 [Homalodisca vitripennis]|nr:hypothetical protein J6590_011539 [Homalodisca vitripennis]